MDDRQFRDVSTAGEPGIYGVDRRVYGVIACQMRYDTETRFKDCSEAAELSRNFDHPSAPASRLSRLEPEELDTLQLLINHGTIQDTLTIARR